MQGFDTGASCDDFESAFIAGDVDGVRGAEGGGGVRFCGVDALDLVDVGGIERCAEEADCALGVVGRGDGVGVQAV